MKKSHRRDFLAYLKFFRGGSRDFYPSDYPLVLVNRLKGTIKAFVEFDSTGKMVDCRNPNVLQAALRGKALLNLQIKMWGEGMQDCGARYYFENELKPAYSYMPDWVWIAVENVWMKSRLVQHRNEQEFWRKWNEVVE